MLEDDQLDLIIDVPHPDTINYQSELVAREQILPAAPKAMDKQLQKNLTLDGSLRLTADLKAPFHSADRKTDHWADQSENL